MTDQKRWTSRLRTLRRQAAPARKTPPKVSSPSAAWSRSSPPDDDAWLTAESDQVSRYWERYRLVLVTNTRDFSSARRGLTGQPRKAGDSSGWPAPNESFESPVPDTPRIRPSGRPRTRRVPVPRPIAPSHASVEPKDLAWLLASYARDGLATSVEDRLATPKVSRRHPLCPRGRSVGVQFRGQQSARPSSAHTLVQTLGFYGVFSAWVLWARQTRGADRFIQLARSRLASARRFVLRALFQQPFPTPDDCLQLAPTDLSRCSDWTAAALDRVDRADVLRPLHREPVPNRVGERGRPVLLRAVPGGISIPDLRQAAWRAGTRPPRWCATWSPASMLGRPKGRPRHPRRTRRRLNVYVLDPCCGTGLPISPRC